MLKVKGLNLQALDFYLSDDTVANTKNPLSVNFCLNKNEFSLITWI